MTPMFLFSVKNVGRNTQDNSGSGFDPISETSVYSDTDVAPLQALSEWGREEWRTGVKGHGSNKGLQLRSMVMKHHIWTEMAPCGGQRCAAAEDCLHQPDITKQLKNLFLTLEMIDDCA